MSQSLRSSIVWLSIVTGITVAVQESKLVSRVAAEPLRRGIEFERADFPADQPNAWPKEVSKSVAVPREEFVTLVERLNARTRGPRPAWLKSAHYEAILVNDTLVSGLMTASVQRLDGPSSLLELGPFSFAIKELKWQNRNAIWGSSSDGRAWVLTDESGGELLGEWSCSGRKFPGGIDFDLQLPEATTSFLDLRIPRNYAVYVPGADVTLLSDAPAEATRLWRIQCGNDSHCRVTCVSKDAIETRRTALLVEHDMHVVVREEDLRFQLILNLEALDAPMKEVMLAVPAGLTIYSAIYGSETPVPFQRVPESDLDGKLLIRLPGPLVGRGRTLRIDGIAVKEPDRPAISPQIVVENSTFGGGRQSVIVQSPLQTRSIRSSGYRQLTPLMPTPDGESITFQQLSSDAQLILDVHRPPVSLSGQIFSLLVADEESWMLDSEITWTSPTGGGFRTSCLFPPQWEVTDVQMASNATGGSAPRTADSASLARPETDKLSWDVRLQEGGQSLTDGQALLSIEFLEAIQPGQPRAVRVIARRRPPESGQVVPVPLPQLLNCDTSEVVLGIEVLNSMTPDLSDDARFERIAPPLITSFAATPDNFERRWYRGDSLENGGTFKVTPQLPQVQVKTETVIDALPSEYRVRYSIQYQPRMPHSDRLLVYLTEANTDVRWTLKGSKPAELSASRLKKSQHVEWNLPAKGELWEIRLPRLLDREVTIEGTSTNRWSSPNRPALALVPHAIEKISQLKLTHPDSLQLNVELDGLKPTGERSCWWYATSEAVFGLEMRNPEPSLEFPLMVSMQLSTLMTTDDAGFDLYRARLQLENGSAQESMRIKLDPAATLQDVIVDGQSIAVKIRDGEFVIPGLNATRKDAVELVYRVPARSSIFYEKRPIIVPDVSARVLGFFWEFTVPPSARLFAEPSGAQLSRSLPTPTWRERLFGPLGRSKAEPLFHPLNRDSWLQLFQPPVISASPIGIAEGTLRGAAEGQRHDAATAGVPLNLSVELWHTARIKLLTWISVGVCLTLGIGLRMLNWRSRDQFAAYVLGLSIAATVSAPMPYAGLLGGAVVGTLIALLIPRQLLMPTTRPRGSLETSLRNLPATLTACLLGAVTFAGSTSLFHSTVQAQETSVEAGGSPAIPRVYVPVDDEGSPSESLPFVYVPRDVLSRWKGIASEQGTTPDYLISSANYELRGTSESHWNVQATYSVHLLPSSEPSVVVELALADVSLPDAESCLVNGKPYPIGALPNGKGYSIELIRSEIVPKSELPASAQDSTDPLENISTFKIELRLRKPRPVGRVFELAIPAVVNSHLSLILPEPFPYASVTGARGASARDEDNYRIESDLGLTSLVVARWGPSSPLPKAQFGTASLLQHLELRPSSVELRFHLEASMEEGSLEALEFDLPANAIVRRVHSRDDDLLRSDVIVLPSGQRRLRLIFDKPRRSQIVVDGTLLLIQSDSLVQTTLPKFGLATSEWLEWRYERNWWGVSSPSDFRVEASNLDPEYVNSINGENYLQAWIDATAPLLSETVVPTQAQIAFELRAAANPTFVLIPYHPRRRAVQWQQSGSIGKRRLDWSLVGEIETSLAPVFQTVLDVDRRLRIEKISVIENGAERRIRWTESRTNPSRIVVFHDKSQGRQTISLRGSLPIRSGVPINLPFVRPEDCDVANAKLVLSRDPEVDVVLTPPRDWKADSDGLSAANLELDGQLLLGRFLLPDTVVRGTIQTSSRHSRCSTRAAAILRRSEADEWKLSYRIEMTPEGESPMRMGLSFPESFTDMESVTVEKAEPAWRDPNDGVRQLDLLLNRGDDSGTVIVQFETRLSEPTQSDWGLPLPVALNSNAHETLLVIDPEEIWFPAGGREVRVADLPEWSSAFFAEIPGGGTAFRVAGPTVRIQREVVAPDLREPSIRLLDQRMWWHGSGKRAGITQAFLSSVRSDLEIQLPSGSFVTAVFLDDHPLPLAEPAGQKLMIPMTDAGTESLLTLAWTAEEVAVPRWEQSSTEAFPFPVGIRIERNLVTILPDSPIRLWCRAGLTEINSFDQGLDRLEALLERHHALGSETRSAVANRWRLDQLQTNLLAHVTKELTAPTKQSEDRLQRRSQIIEAIDRLEPVPEAPQMSWQSRLLEEPPVDCLGCIRGQSNLEARIEVISYNHTWLMSLGSCLLALILVPLLRQVIRVKWGQFLQRHASISGMLLATIWWLFLTPSALGPLLMLVSILRMVRPHTSVKPSTSL